MNNGNFIRLDLFQIVRHLAIMEGIIHFELLSDAMVRLGRTLRTAHELGIYHCFTHPESVDAHGNLIDYEHAIYGDGIPAIKESVKLKSEDAELLNEAGLKITSYKGLDFPSPPSNHHVYLYLSQAKGR